MDDLQLVKEMLITAGHTAGYSVSNNLEAIAKAKLRFFGVGDCLKCPCHREGNHRCISETCQKEIGQNGHCGCRLFERVV